MLSSNSHVVPRVEVCPRRRLLAGMPFLQQRAFWDCERCSGPALSPLSPRKRSVPRSFSKGSVPWGRG